MDIWNLCEGNCQVFNTIGRKIRYEHPYKKVGIKLYNKAYLKGPAKVLQVFKTKFFFINGNLGP